MACLQALQYLQNDGKLEMRAQAAEMETAQPTPVKCHKMALQKMRGLDDAQTHVFIQEPRLSANCLV